jgi:outer membrane protein TolC
VTADVKALYYRLAWAGAVTEALAHHRVLMETLVQVTESRYSVGAGQQPDVLKAQTDVTMMAIRLERMQQERAVAEARLAALLGRPAGTAIGEVAPLTLPDTAALDTLAAAIDRAPALDRDRSIVASADAALALARRDAKPALGVSAGYYNMGSMPDMYMFRLDVRVPLQRASRDAAVAERTSRLAEARAMTARTTRELAAEVDEDVQVARSAARLARLYHDTALPQARLALDSAMASYETGKIDFLSVTMSVTGVVEYEMSYYDELRNVHEALSRLEAVTGHVLAH